MHCTWCLQAQVFKEVDIPDAAKSFKALKFLESLGYKQPASFDVHEKVTGDKVLLPPQHPYWAKEGQGRLRRSRTRALLNQLVW
jgi:hypothetical protein